MVASRLGTATWCRGLDANINNVALVCMLLLWTLDNNNDSCPWSVRNAVIKRANMTVCAARIIYRVMAQVTLTTGPVPEGSGNVLPVSYDKFTSMVQPGDTVFLGRYLVTGSEDSSLYLTVRPIFKGAVVGSF